mgnify:CR=1 FL=1
MKRLAFVFSVLALQGCTTTTTQYAGETSGQGVGSERYDLRIRMDRQMRTGMLAADIRNDLFLYVNEVLAVRGPLHRNESGQLQGMFDGEVVLVDCIKPGIFSYTRCTVHIDGRDIGTLPLEMVR